MRRGLLIIPILCLSLAACSSSSKTASNVNTTTSEPQSDFVLTETVFIKKVDLKNHTITIDPMAFLTGAAATSAYKQANPDSKESAPPNDYYIANPTVEHNKYPLAPNAVVRLVHVGGTDHTQPVVVSVTSLKDYPNLDKRPFMVTMLNGTVNKVVETFVP